jgi:glycosyltransferase involved in cell wall biosynthesis
VTQSNPAALKVAFDHRIFVTQQFGGITRYFAGLTTHLPEFGTDARIIAPLHISDRLTRLPRSRVIGVHAGQFRGRFRAARLLGDALHAPLTRAYGADIVHETYFDPRRLAPKKCALVLTVYDMIFEMKPEIPHADFTVANKKAAIERADKIICISESTRRDLIRFYPQAESRAVVTLLGFDAEFERDEDETEPPLHPAPYLLYVGMRRDYKNFSGLLDAYASSPTLKAGFDLVCISNEPFTDDERRAISDLGLGDKVFQRRASDMELRRWYTHAALFAYPSLYEGFGIPPLEAMAAGCPVVCMRTSSIPEVCGDAAEYADPDAPESLGVALERVANSANRAAELRSAGRQRVSQFSWRRCAEETNKVYRSLR